VEGHLFGAIRQAGYIDHILQHRAAPDTGLDVDHFHAAAVGAQVDMVAVQRQVLVGVAGAQGVGRRAVFERPLDQLGMGAHDLSLAVDSGAVRLPDLQRPAGGEAHANMFDDPQRGFTSCGVRTSSRSFGLVMDLI
jgi:hypothetical protein